MIIYVCNSIAWSSSSNMVMVAVFGNEMVSVHLQSCGLTSNKGVTGSIRSSLEMSGASVLSLHKEEVVCS